MRAKPELPIRLVDLAPEQDLVGAAPLVRAAATPLPDITPASRREIRGRLHVALRGGRRVAFRPRHPVFVLVVVLVAGAMGGAAVESAISKWRSSRAARASAPAAPAADAPRRPARRVAVAPVVPPPEPEPAGDPPPAAPPKVVPRRQAPPDDARPRAPAGRASAPSAVPPAPPTAPPPLEIEPAPAAQSPAARAEATMLADAIRKLRVGGDVAGALALLDERRARFGDGVLAPEAAAVRIEALLAAGRTDAALLELDRLDLDRIPRRDEWRVARGELRASSGRWSDAQADFESVLAGRSGQSDDDVVGRALWGRGVARARLGNRTGAHDDWTEYLRRFPGGRFAAAAGAALGTPTPR